MELRSWPLVIFSSDTQFVHCLTLLLSHHHAASLGSLSEPRASLLEEVVIEISTSLNKFTKWHYPTRNLHVGDLVVLQDDGMVPTKRSIMGKMAWSEWPLWKPPRDRTKDLWTSLRFCWLRTNFWTVNPFDYIISFQRPVRANFFFGRGSNLENFLNLQGSEFLQTLVFICNHLAKCLVYKS